MLQEDAYESVAAHTRALSAPQGTRTIDPIAGPTPPSLLHQAQIRLEGGITQLEKTSAPRCRRCWPFISRFLVLLSFS